MHASFGSLPEPVKSLTQGANISRTGNKTSATVTPSKNKAERAAIAEVIESRVASMGRPTVGVDAKAKPSKPKKDCIAA